MQKFFIFLLASALLASCNNNAKPDRGGKNGDTTNSGNSSTPAAANPLDTLLGSYVGDFGDNKITLLIVKAENDSILGRTVVGGNDRPFSGTLTRANGICSITAAEPDDDPNDGVFSFSVNLAKPDSLTGSWKPNDPKKKSKIYALGRKAFVYRADVGEYPEASQRLLAAKDVENMMKEDLQYMRNEIFARHGYCFKKKDLRQMFEYQDWYVPDVTDIKDKLTEIEKKNVLLIKHYEKYAEEYGDDYGR